MSSSHTFAIMSLQSLEEKYHEVCYNYLSYSAISAIASGKDSMYQTNSIFEQIYMFMHF